MTDTRLFDPARTTPAICSVCGATRQPEEQKAPSCSVDRDRAAGVERYRRRPVGCLNVHDPATAPFPPGF